MEAEGGASVEASALQLESSDQTVCRTPCEYHGAFCRREPLMKSSVDRSSETRGWFGALQSADAAALAAARESAASCDDSTKSGGATTSLLRSWHAPTQRSVAHSHVAAM